MGCNKHVQQKESQSEEKLQERQEERIDEIAQEPEEAVKQRDMKKVYDTMRLLSG